MNFHSCPVCVSKERNYWMKQRNAAFKLSTYEDKRHLSMQFIHARDVRVVYSDEKKTARIIVG